MLDEALFSFSPVSALLTFGSFAASLPRLKSECGNLTKPSAFSKLLFFHALQSDARIKWFLLFVKITFGMVLIK